MELEKRIYNGDRAKEVLENEAFNDAFDDMKTEIIRQWTNSNPNEEAAREKLHMMLRLLGQLKATLTTSLETGQLAKLDLQHQQSLLSKAKKSLGIS